MKITLIAVYLFLFNSLLVSQEHIVKFATVAPDGSSWVNIMKEYDAAVRKESGGKLGFKIWAGSVAGDEQDVLRKIRLGQFHSEGITGNGISEIAKPVRVLDLPFFFKTQAEVDFILDRFDEEFRREFENNGFVLLGWAEVGTVYIISKTPVSKVSDLQSVKMWQWEGDPVASAMFNAVGISPIQLKLQDVITSLQTGLITGAYASPYAILTLQWNTATSYLMEYPITNASGAVVISKKEFDKLPSDLQQILLKNGKQYMRKLTEQSRKDNAKSLDILKKNGMHFVKPDPSEVKTYDEIGKRSRKALVGKLFTEDLLNRVEKSLAEFRAKGGK